MKCNEARCTPVRGQKASLAGLSFVCALFAFFMLVVISDAMQTPAWFDGRPNGYGFPYDWLKDPLDSFMLVGLFCIPLAIWHGFDLIAKDDRESADLGFFDSYFLVLGCFLAGMVGSAIVMSGFTSWLSCWEPRSAVQVANDNGFFSFCTPDPLHLWEILILPFLLALFILSFAKVVLVLHRSFPTSQFSDE